MKLMSIRKAIFPMTTFVFLTGAVACNNNDNNSYTADKKSTQTAIDFVKRGFVNDVITQDFDSLVDVNALDEIQIENNIDIEVAWRNFKANGQSNTAIDSVAMYDVAMDHVSTSNAIDYLKAMAAIKGFEYTNVKPYYCLSTFREVENYLDNPGAGRLYNEFMVKDSRERELEFCGQE